MVVNVQPHAQVTAPPRKQPLVPIKYEADWAQSRSGHYGEDKISSLCGTGTPDRLREDQICTIHDSQEWVNINTVIRFEIP
jgi:hypothetical protein